MFCIKIWNIHTQLGLKQASFGNSSFGTKPAKGNERAIEMEHYYTELDAQTLKKDS